MDPTEQIGLDSEPDDWFWEADYRRKCTDRDRHGDSITDAEVPYADEDNGSTPERAERLAEAMYEC